MVQDCFQELDQILRGEKTRLSALRSGSINVSLAGLVIILLFLGIFYGGCIGFYSLIQSGGSQFTQWLASIVKIPMLFFLTLCVTFPSLYIFNTLIGVRISVVTALQILLATLGVMMAVMASLGPIVIFFSLSTSSYPFIVLLNVIVCSISGVLGLGFLLRTLDRLVIIQEEQEFEANRLNQSLESRNDDDSLDLTETDISSSWKTQTDAGAANMIYKSDQAISVLDKVDRFTRKKAKSVFRVWMLVFALVGAQMSWVLRPYIGSPEKPFTFFREQEGNFFIRVFESIIALLSN